jgi:DNA-binding IclR family transcriptional regulator
MLVRSARPSCPPQQFTARTLTTLPAIEAELARVRAQGYAEDLDEFVDGVSCVAAPVFDGRGAVYGALAVSLPTLRYRSVCAMAHDAVITAACAATGALADEVRRFASTT